jgi:hypothetical protein
MPAVCSNGSRRAMPALARFAGMRSTSTRGCEYETFFCTRWMMDGYQKKVEVSMVVVVVVVVSKRLLVGTANVPPTMR